MQKTTPISNDLKTDENSASKEDCEWDLLFIKVKISQNVRLIPIELVEAVKGRTFTPEQFYKYQEEQMRIENAANLLYLLVDSKQTVQGYLWAQISGLDGTMFINTFSISEKYWFKGKAIPNIVKFLSSLKEKHKCKRVFWVTTNDKFFLKQGFKKSKNVLMEFCS